MALRSLLGPAGRAFDLVMNPPPAPIPAMEGRQLGGYRIVRENGHGGMGSVYLAERVDVSYRKQVAIKLVRPAAAARKSSSGSAASARFWPRSISRTSPA